MKTSQLGHSLILLLTAVIWGVAFVAQSVGMDYVGPFTFTCARSLIGGLVLLPCIALLNRMNGQKGNDRKAAAEKLSEEEKRKKRKMLILGGICCGLALCAASCFQQFGIQYTTVGKAGFITAFYIIIVPVISLFFGKKCGPLVWAGVLFALSGLYFLCITESFQIGMGDILVFICAFLFAVHILVIDYFTQYVDGVKMSCIQFFVCGAVSGAAMLLFEEPSVSALLSAWQPVLYAGVLSSGAGYTLQIIGQKGMNPTVASLILSLESVVSVLAGLLLLGETLSGREVLGCVLMSAAIVLAQLPQKQRETVSCA
ncbi:DMT family transporter [Lachnoclostridium sp. An138]|uniref:DMT family transporter n=1 Tax=Lachnoclostridium sp. An138 TaxID=1965560 RepID=UPI000B39FA09|nr:DMT family transporter [Lachnoclostridium sp. An138]OUQ18467.1 EamA family transporter [Lachnoclostridium sp. An138]